MLQLELLFQRGEIVFAKCAGSEPWPAVIMNVLPDYFIYNVKFYNHRSTAYIQEENLVKFTEEIAKKYLKLYKNSDDAALRAIVKGIQRALVQFDKKQSEKVALAITAKSRSRYKAVAPIKKQTYIKVESKVQKSKAKDKSIEELKKKKLFVSKNKANQSENSLYSLQDTYFLRSRSYNSPTTVVSPKMRKQKLTKQKKLKAVNKGKSGKKETSSIVMSRTQNNKSKSIEPPISIQSSRQQKTKRVDLALEPYPHINNIQGQLMTKSIDEKPNQQGFVQKPVKIEVEESIQSLIQTSHHKSVIQPCVQQKQYKDYEPAISVINYAFEQKQQPAAAPSQVMQSIPSKQQPYEQPYIKMKCEQEERKIENVAQNLGMADMLRYLDEIKLFLTRDKVIAALNKSLVKEQHPFQQHIQVEQAQLVQEIMVRQLNSQSQVSMQECSLIKMEDCRVHQAPQVDLTNRILANNKHWKSMDRNSAKKSSKDEKKAGIKMEEEIQPISIEISVVEKHNRKPLKQQSSDQTFQYKKAIPFSQDCKIQHRQKETKIEEISGLIESFSVALQGQNRQPSQNVKQEVVSKPVKRKQYYSNFREENRCNEYSAILSGISRHRLALQRRSPEYICNTLKKFLRILIREVDCQVWGSSIGLTITRKQLFFTLLSTDILSLKQLLKEKCIELMFEFFYKFKSSRSLMKGDCQAQFQLIKTKLSLYSYQFTKNYATFEMAEEQKMGYLQQFTKFENVTSK